MALYKIYRTLLYLMIYPMALIRKRNQDKYTRRVTRCTCSTELTTNNVVIANMILYDAESGSESSASSIGKKKDGLDVPMDYKNDHFGNPVEAWRQDCDPRHYRHSAEYDELSYPPKVRLALSLLAGTKMAAIFMETKFGKFCFSP